MLRTYFIRKGKPTRLVLDIRRAFDLGNKSLNFPEKKTETITISTYEITNTKKLGTNKENENDVPQRSVLRSTFTFIVYINYITMYHVSMVKRHSV